jgi:hypothetical protein
VTDKFSWAIGVDPAYEAVNQASGYFSASEILGRYLDKEEESQNEWDTGDYLLKAIKENIATGTAGEDENIGGIVVNDINSNSIGENSTCNFEFKDI